MALAPGEEFDRDGCFSGSAVDDIGILSLIYTCHVWLSGEGYNRAIREVQCLATRKDGIHFTKQGVVLSPPENIMLFRDPKVWQEKVPWTLDRVLAKANAGTDYMWECPDFFPLGQDNIVSARRRGSAHKAMIIRTCSRAVTYRVTGSRVRISALR